MRVTRARRRPPRVRRASSAILLVAALSLMTIIGFAAANTVPASKAADLTSVVTAEHLKPAACNGITLTTVVTGSATFNGTSGADLMLGSSGADSMNGLNGNDCIVAGAGNDTLNGGGGTDVCIGGAGVNTFQPSCETQI